MSIHISLPVRKLDAVSTQILTILDNYFNKGANLIPALHNRTDRLALVMNDIVNNEKVVTDARLKGELCEIVDEIGGYKAMLKSITMIEELTIQLEDVQVAMGSNYVAPGRAKEVVKVYLHQKPT